METKSKYIQFFENLMNPSKEIRTQAEKDLEIIKQKPIEETFPIFQEGISSTNQTLSQLATLMFKKTYLDNAEISSKLSETHIENFKSFIRSQIDFKNKEWKSLKLLGEVLALLYQLSDIKKSFSEIMELFNNEEFLARKLSMFLISNLSDLKTINDDLISNNVNDFKNIFNKCFNDTNDTVKSSAIIAFNRFIVNIQNEKIRDLFSDMIPNLLKSILTILQNTMNIEQEILNSLIFLVDSHPKFFKNHIDLIIEVVCKIVSEQKINFTTRTSALEIIYSFSNSIPAKIRNSENFKKLFIPLLFNLILEIDNINNLENWEKETDANENDLEYMFYSVKSGLERLSIDLGGIFIMNNMNENIKKYLNSQNWVEIHGGFAVLAYITEGCKEVFSKNLKELLQYISQGLINENPRVRYISLIFFGNLLRETAPKPQKEFTNNILPGLAKLLTNNEKSLRVKTKACEALNEFLAGLLSKNKNIEQNIKLLSPYINELVSFITNLFENSLNINYEPLQKNSLECLSLLANIHEKHFAPYYEKIMPGLKKLYFHLKAETDAQKQLKTHCINTIGYLFSSISENYQEHSNDYKEISENFLKDLANLPEEDPQIIAITEAFVQISLGMNFSDFEPIFKQLFNYLNKYINADIGLTLKDAQEDEYIPDNNNNVSKNMGSAIFNIGVISKKISVNTFALQLKITSFEALNEIALNLGESFKPYIENYLNTAKKLLNFAYSRKIRKIAMKSIYTCINACSKDEERKKVFEMIINELLDLLNFDINSKFFKDMKCIIKYIGKSVNLFEENFNIDKSIIEKIFDMLKNVIIATQNKINDIYNLFTNDEDGIYDSNDRSDQNTDIYQLQKNYLYINNLFKYMIKLYEDDLTPFAKKYLAEYYFEMWENELKTILNDSNLKNKQHLKNAHENNVAMSINFFNAFLEFANMETFNQIIDKYYENSQKIEDSEEILKNVLVGYGIICKRVEKNIFANKYKNIFDFINKILHRNQTPENLFTYDKAINTFGKFVYYQCNEDDFGYKTAKEFLGMLPAVNDLDESDHICSEFFDQITDNNNTLLIGDANKEVTKQAVMRIMDLNGKEQFVDDVTKLVVVSMSLGLKFDNLVE